MSFKSQKEKIFGKIAAEKTLVEGKYDYKKKQISNSIESINNKKGQIIEFLIDLISALVGFMVLINVIVDTLTYYLGKIEIEIKNALKVELKSIVSCGVDPSLPDFIKSTGTGIQIEVSKIDFLDIFLVDPLSQAGQLLYNDTASFLNSKDFNTFLYGVIQTDGIGQTWNNTHGDGLIDVTFNSLGSGTIPNNTFTIRANQNYDNKTLTDLNNDFVDSLTLFNTKGLLNKIIDAIYGSISFSIKKTTKQLKKEAEIDTVVDKIINAEYDDIIDDSYFTFTNDEEAAQLISVNMRKRGFFRLETANSFNAEIPINMLSNFNNDFDATLSVIDKKLVLSNHLNLMAAQTAVNAFNPPDNITIKLNFVQQIFNQLTKSIINALISPKVILIFLINLKIIYGPTATYKDGVDFIKKNKNIFKSMVKKIVQIVMNILLRIALKRISELVATAIVKRQIEKQIYTATQTAGLVAYQANLKFREYKKSLKI